MLKWRHVITPESFNTAWIHHGVSSVAMGDGWLNRHLIPANQCDRVVVLPWLRLAFFRMHVLNVNGEPRLNQDSNDIEREWWMRWLRSTPPMAICEA